MLSIFGEISPSLIFSFSRSLLEIMAINSLLVGSPREASVQLIFNFSRSLSEIMAINSLLVGFPRELWMV